MVYRFAHEPRRIHARADRAPRYKRVLLKISGEVLMGEGHTASTWPSASASPQEVTDAAAAGVEICLVIGGGNIFRGMQGAAKGMERASADYMGMLATVMNALAMQNALEALGGQTRVQSAIPMMTVCEPYIRRRAMRHMEKGRVVIFAAGTGNPFFTTDTAAALRAAEMGCDALLKGTHVDGVYTADPKKDQTATRYDTLSYHEVLARDLRGHGRLGHQPDARQRHSDRRVLDPRARRPRRCAGRARRLHHHQRLRTNAHGRLAAFQARRLQEAHGRRVTALKDEFGGLRTGRASPSCSIRSGRGLRRVIAAEPGRQRQRARAAHDLGQRLGQERSSAPSTRRSARRTWASTRSSTARPCASRSRR